MLGLLLVLSVLFSACLETIPEKTTEKQPFAKVRPSAEEPILYFGVISRYNPIVMYKNYQPLMDYLSAQTPYRFELKLGKTYEDAVGYLREGHVDIASLGGLTYLVAHQQFGAKPLVKPLNKDGKGFYQSIFIVRDDSPLHDLKDLRGRSLALGAVHSTSGNLMPRYELSQAGIALNDLKHIENLPHHDSVAKAVLAGRFEVGAVKDIVAHQYKKKGLRFIHVSAPIPSVPLTIQPDAADTLAQAIAQALLKLDPSNAQHRLWMQDWDSEFRYGFAPAADSDYALLKSYLGRVSEGCKQQCHQ